MTEGPVSDTVTVLRPESLTELRSVVTEQRRVHLPWTERSNVEADIAMAPWNRETTAGSKSRQDAQRGLFTKISDSIHFDVESYLKSTGRLDALRRYELPSSSLRQVVSDLFAEDIHYASLFPDAWGAAKYANLRRYVSPETLGKISSRP